MIAIQRGDIFYAHLPKSEGSEQQGQRPIIIVQNDIGNVYSPTLIAVPLTSVSKRNMPTHVAIGTGFGIEKNSIALAEQIMTIDKSRLIRYVGSIDKRKMDEIDMALRVSLDLNE